MNRKILPGLGAALLLAAALQAPAQTAADGTTRSLGGGTAATGKLLSYDELKACLEQQDSLAARRTRIESTRAPLDAEKQALVAEQAGLKAERAKVDEVQRVVGDLGARYKAYTDAVVAWNARSKAAADLTGSAAEAERDTLARDRVTLQDTLQALEAERLKLGDTPQKVVDSFNTQATALDARVSAWNERNAALTREAEALNGDREAWVGACGNRRYREGDETAIRRGK